MDLVDGKLPWWQRSVVKILKMGEIPKHIGYIMDGNRRYARSSNIATIQGHEKGKSGKLVNIKLQLKISLILQDTTLS